MPDTPHSRASPLPQLICVHSALPEQLSRNRTILVRQLAPYPPNQPILVRNFPSKLAERHSFAP
ncbi:hypothetical protein DYL59_10550 [Pseudomonas kairouanensis]|uniref:Uncharacterized protein n=1 Tax=Pseudomonas kairouanensis TaxID=2293832 RepID=A0A4Z0ATN7_9PSED|nr:hypothetical protein DYL59_10550 [Pseudomonas kairouanensis]